MLGRDEFFARIAVVRGQMMLKTNISKGDLDWRRGDRQEGRAGHSTFKGVLNISLARNFLRESGAARIHA